MSLVRGGAGGEDRHATIGPMTELIVETTDPEPHPGFRGDTEPLLAFLAFGAAVRYGSLHPLSGVASLLRKRHKLDTRPLFEFGDAVPEDEIDARWSDVGKCRGRRLPTWRTPALIWYNRRTRGIVRLETGA